MSNLYSRAGSGRIHPGERGDDDDQEDFYDAEPFSLLPEHEAEVTKTLDHSEKPATRKDYRSRLQRMVDWCIKNYPEFAAQAIRPITAEDRDDKSRHYHNQKSDFVYDLLDGKIIEAYLSVVRKKSKDGKTVSYSHIRKFHDAILFGAREQGTVLKKNIIQFLVDT